MTWTYGTRGGLQFAKALLPVTGESFENLVGASTRKVR
jgi:hypothetical protein